MTGTDLVPIRQMNFVSRDHPLSFLTLDLVPYRLVNYSASLLQELNALNQVVVFEMTPSHRVLVLGINWLLLIWLRSLHS